MLNYIIDVCIFNPKDFVFNLALICLLTYGVLNSVNPHKMWDTFRSWKCENKPNEAYFSYKRIQGILFALFSAYMLIRPFIAMYISRRQL